MAQTMAGFFIQKNIKLLSPQKMPKNQKLNV